MGKLINAKVFWGYVNKDGPAPSAVAVSQYPEIAGTCCWVWTGGLDRKGYGHASAGIAHRIAFMLAYGHYPMPLGCHKCDVSACCNPCHIFEGTHQQNEADKVAKGRYNNQPRDAKQAHANHRRAALAQAGLRRAKRAQRPAFSFESFLADVKHTQQ